MRVQVLKRNIQSITFFPPLSKNFIYFIENKLYSKVLEEKEDYFIIEVDDEYLSKQNYKDKEWYQSKDRKFGIFQVEEGWRLLFQRR